MVTKRQVGIFIALIGLMTAGGAIIVDWMGAGEWGGFGPLQQIGLGIGAVELAAGLLLIRLGDRPA